MIAVSKQAAASGHLALGSTVRVTFASNASKTYAVQVIYSVRDLTGDYILPLAAARAYFPQALDVDVFVKLAPGVSAAAGRHAIGEVLASYPNATLQDQVQYKAQQAQQVNQLLNLVYGLLALAIIIALIGIANTLALSVHERTRHPLRRHHRITPEPPVVTPDTPAHHDVAGPRNNGVKMGFGVILCTIAPQSHPEAKIHPVGDGAGGTSGFRDVQVRRVQERGGAGTRPRSL